ncbi:E3 ubiquitin-protein ligase E3D isoform X1 [Electrophorus electricus]|uniref:E3 ubiquitin-protein ligase E3D n=1 Tax=Electrophorus electricus TaxID=8005 RepID=A0A4W4HJ71_ELEEL|nr:E3 ubiquitin-protein ligase E3D isoform X1 [Electrophorus electricus]
MEGTEKQDLIFLELRQRLQSGLLIIRSDAFEDKAEVNVTSRDSAIEIHVPDGGYLVKLKPGVSLVEGSWHKSQQLNADGLHVRLHLRVDQPSEALDSATVCLKALEKYHFLCQSCGAILVKEKVFRRVLPLPNGNWNALVDDWCCHPDPFANKKLLPQEEDCLVGDTYFLLTRDSSCDNSLTQQIDSSCVNLDTSQYSVKQTAGCKNVVVFCKMCSAVLGEAVTSEVLKFYITEVVIKQSEEREFTVPQHRQQFLERALTSRLLELSSAQSIFRFSIQTPDCKSVIMLWLLNTDTLIASFSEKVTSSNGLISSDRHLDEHQSCQAASAVKVLYLACNRAEHQEAVDAWEKDISVHPLALPWSTCDELLQLLSSCTSTLPPSLSSMNSYQVAYLKR